MTVLGILLMLIAIAGVWDGPVDKEYLEDWAAWLFFVIVGLIGFLMVFPMVLT